MATKRSEAALPLGRLAYDRIRESIQSGALGPGDRILEDDLAKRLEMSRTPVREAVRQLEAEGLLVHEAHRGVAVARLDYQAVMELYSVREVLEGTAAGMAARHASDAEIMALEELLQAEVRDGDAPTHLADHNRRFHQALYRAAHNRFLLRALNAQRDPMMLLSRTTLELPERRAIARGEHRAILDAIAARDPAKAEAAARAHITGAHRARLTLMVESEDDGL